MKNNDSNETHQHEDKRFSFDGHDGSLDEFLTANSGDVEVCRWLLVCELGEVMDGCKRIK